MDGALQRLLKDLQFTIWFRDSRVFSSVPGGNTNGRKIFYISTGLSNLLSNHASDDDADEECATDLSGNIFSIFWK